jgi:hypothetical protein
MLVPNSGLTISFTSSRWSHVLLPRSWHCHNSGGVQQCRPGPRPQLTSAKAYEAVSGGGTTLETGGFGTSHPIDTKETLKDVPQRVPESVEGREGRKIEVVDHELPSILEMPI